MECLKSLSREKMSSSKLWVVWQEEEVSEDLLTFHEVVNHMQEAEEEILDDHRVVIDVSENMALEIRMWLKCLLCVFDKKNHQS